MLLSVIETSSTFMFSLLLSCNRVVTGINCRLPVVFIFLSNWATLT